ncbi:DUF817 domain-containing protein [Micromonospora endophytica]|uniref:DUF817 domain-containing protein n=1 Tax=Micromonospora endophytica TaxID=515350 RepID=A0A2W2DUJ4_9ACTN|nr:DUF817 domain-containing protein [Micromonospora endophytica]PZG00817.1 DUF817 domain-containing protein [Micromonospora endophytica]RIW42058.1 DUF817 domain-containing protein [Micromonospora endophytica]BCJ59678.1 membrane protein [Micromonospora endophytica]
MDTPDGAVSLTTTERAIDARFRAVLARLPQRGPVGWLTEFLVFGLKQAWACVFGAAMLAVILAAHLWYPADAPLARNDFLTVAAIAIQIAMLLGRLESLRELRVVVLFHLVGTIMELFKTHIGSWTYEPDGVLRLGAVPLFSGFMYAAVGSYMVRVNRLFDLRFSRYPRRWLTAGVAAAIYLNFFTNHYVQDVRWLLIAIVALVFGRCVMRFRIFRLHWRMPLLLAFLLVAFFIWLAENIATWSNAWLYPSQVDGWHPVSLTKLASWFLLMIISVVLVTWIAPPQPPEPTQPPDDRQRLESAARTDAA